MSGCGARTAAGSLEAVFELSDAERFGWTLMESVNGGVKAGHWGGAKTGQFCGVGIEHDAPRPPRRRWPGFRSRGGRGFQEARMISPVSGSAAAATSSGGRGSRRRLAFDCLSR